MAKIVVSFSEAMVEKLESEISNGVDIEISYDQLDGDIQITSDTLSKCDLEDIVF